MLTLHEFIEKFSGFEKKVYKEINNFKDNHPVLNNAISAAFILLPPPFSAVAQNMYNNFEGNPNEKIDAVKGYLKNIELQGESHFNQIMLKVENIQPELDKISEQGAKEKTLKQLEQAMLSYGDDIEKNFSSLSKEIKELGKKMDSLSNQAVEESEHTRIAIHEESEYIRDEIHAIRELLLDTTIYARPKLMNEGLEVEQLKSQLSKKERKDLEYVNSQIQSGNSHFYKKEYTIAIARYDAVLDFDKQNISALNNKGNALGDLGQHQYAIECFDQAIKIKPDHVGAFNNKGIALDNLERYKDAIECYNQAIKIKPDDAGAFNNKGIALDNLGQHQDAIECFDQAIKIKPDDAGAFYNKAVSLLVFERFDESKSCYNTAVNLDVSLKNPELENTLFSKKKL